MKTEVKGKKNFFLKSSFLKKENLKAHRLFGTTEQHARPVAQPKTRWAGTMETSRILDVDGYSTKYSENLAWIDMKLFSHFIWLFFSAAEILRCVIMGCFLALFSDTFYCLRMKKQPFERLLNIFFSWSSQFGFKADVSIIPELCPKIGWERTSAR